MTNCLTVYLFALLGLTLAAKFSTSLEKSGTFYLAPVFVGTPPQPLRVLIDTTISDFWVLDNNCTTPKCHENINGSLKNTYNGAASSTVVYGNWYFDIDYGLEYGDTLQNVGGRVAKDTLKMAGFTIVNQDFGRALTLPTDFSSQPVEGVLGLGWPVKATFGTVSPLRNLFPQLDEPIFTVWLQRSKTAAANHAGVITFGGFDNTGCDSNITYVPLAKREEWGYNVDAFTMGQFTRRMKERTISATGSAFTGVPFPVYQHIIKATNAKYDWNYELFMVPCTMAETGQPIKITIGGKPYLIKSEDYVLDLSLGNQQCALGFYNPIAPFKESIWVLGDALLRGYCHVYDFGNARIGLSNRIDPVNI